MNQQPGSSSQPPWVPHVPVPVNLRRLFPHASFVGCADLRVEFATESSRCCRPGALFAVIRGARDDGAAHLPEAVSRGAAALLVDRPMAAVNLPQCVVPDVRRAYAELWSAMMSHPSRCLGLVGVTGTNGKTTTTWLARSIFKSAGHQTGLLGTIEYHDGRHAERAGLTTPDSATLAKWLAAMVTAHSTRAAMEVSSHALDQRRMAGTLLDAAVITNITHDHFDYHGNFAAYRRCKLSILDYLKPAGVGIINVDDAGARSCLDEAPKRTLTYGLEEPADVTATILDESLEGTRFRLHLGLQTVEAQTRLIGRHNVANCLAAAAAAWHLGATPEKIARGIEGLQRVPGRLDPVQAGQPFNVFVDYAHTEAALASCLASLRPLTSGRLICVFGAGGDRDRSKRPLLARAAQLADLVVVTSDNPRSESPLAIIHDILAGFSGHCRPAVEADRRRAIGWALEQARPGDTVLLAGKGHETEQIIGSERHHFDDAACAREWLGALRPGQPPQPHLRLHTPSRA